eukprot:2441143-Rhodomonas_salina.1
MHKKINWIITDISVLLPRIPPLEDPRNFLCIPGYPGTRVPGYPRTRVRKLEALKVVPYPGVPGIPGTRVPGYRVPEHRPGKELLMRSRGHATWVATAPLRGFKGVSISLKSLLKPLNGVCKLENLKLETLESKHLLKTSSEDQCPIQIQNSVHIGGQIEFYNF